MTTPATDTGRAADEALALRDELMAYAAQLIRMSTQAGLGGRDLSVRVKEPEHLAHLITRAASAIQARKWAAAEPEADHLRAENARLLERIRQAEKGGEAMREPADEPRCTATGNPCGTDTVMEGRQCPDDRWGGLCAHRIARAARAPETHEAGDA